MTNVTTKPRDTLILRGTAAGRVKSVVPSVIEIEDVRAKTGVEFCHGQTSVAAPSCSLQLRCGDILKYPLGILASDHRVIQPKVLVFVLIDPGVAQAGILIALEFVDGVVH